MTVSLAEVESLLAIDVGEVNTRALLFDVVEGRYRFLGVGYGPTTAGAPYQDISEGVRLALDQLQDITGRVLIGDDQQLIIPSQEGGNGVDKCVALLSAGEPLKVILVGLLEDISLASVQRLASSTYAQVVDAISLSDHRKTAVRLDSILRLQPDLILVAGGTEGGASKSVIELLESVGLAYYLLKDQRPEILFAGNQSLVEEVKAVLGPGASLQTAPNLRPTLDIEQLMPSHKYLMEVFRRARLKNMKGVNELNTWSGGHLMPTASAFGRIIRFISKEYARTKKGVLGVDIGASATTLAAAFAGELFLSVHTRLGLGRNIPGILKSCSIEEISRWLSMDIPEDYVRDYIHNKAIYPASLPGTPEDLDVEQALACQALTTALQQVSSSFPETALRFIPGFLPAFEPIIASGSILTRSPKYGQVLLMLLNAIQPVGVTTLALDQNMVAAALGAIAEVNPLVAVQSLDSGNFINLGTVIAPVGRAEPGTTILRVRIKYNDGSESGLDVKYGALEVAPLPLGQAANLQLQPLHRFDLGMGGGGRGGNVKVIGGMLGLVIDARGRPLELPVEPVKRREFNKKWASALRA